MKGNDACASNFFAYFENLQFQRLKCLLDSLYVRSFFSPATVLNLKRFSVEIKLNFLHALIALTD